MNTLTKYIATKTVQPAVKKYLTKTRTYRYKNISLLVPPGVFHPGLFFTTKILLNYTLQYDLKNKAVLELGAGNGLISFALAQKNANVTAIDINERAIEYLHINSKRNHIAINIIQSDLFENIPPQTFDFILINPPFYRKDPETKADYAWYCGKNGEYFHTLFRAIGKYINDDTFSWMILSEDCDTEMITKIASENGFDLKLVHSKKNIIEQNFIFSIEKARLNFDDYLLDNGVYVNQNAAIDRGFEEKYIELRKKENRIYTNDQVKRLPLIENTHPHYKEWILRKQSANRLLKYLRQKGKPLKILEVGCGNGWLSKLLAAAGTYVVGLDVNFIELKQAASIFKKENLYFVYNLLSEKLLSEFKFDIVVFAASAQYFPSIKNTVHMILPSLNTDGEVHILDTNFYALNEVEAAQKRTKDYYSELGFPEFAQHYYHHCFDELKGFCINVMYDPLSVKNIFKASKNPFPWFRIKR
ncbi:MAG: methyltransferase [Parafilimonas sp.]|nr:methyltransferase [Parafilimonas sp.]